MSLPTDPVVPREISRSAITVPFVTMRAPKVLLVEPIWKVTPALPALLYVAARVPPAQTTVDVAPGAPIRTRFVTVSVVPLASIVTIPAVFVKVRVTRFVNEVFTVTVYVALFVKAALSPDEG